MKIGILTSTHKWNDNRVFYKETMSLVDAGYDVTYIAQEASKANDSRMRCVDLPLKNKLGATSLKGMWHIYKVAKNERCDVYHLQDPDLIYVGLLLKMTTKAKVVYDVHEDYPSDMLTKYYLKPYLRKFLSKAMAFSEFLADRFFDAIVVADNFVYRQFSPHKTTILFNYPDTQLMDISLEGGEQTAEKKWDLIFPGTTTAFIVNIILGVAKRFEEMGRPVRVAILSPFVLDGGIDWVRGRIKELGLNESDIWVQQRVPTYEVPKYISASKIGIIPLPDTPKLRKNIPTKLFEFWYCGLPVVASDLPPTAQYMERAKGGFLVKADEVEQYVEQIAYLLDHPDEAQQMAAVGKKLVEDECNWEVEKTKLKTLYEKLLR